jgi:hypothetical protein
LFVLYNFKSRCFTCTLLCFMTYFVTMLIFRSSIWITDTNSLLVILLSCVELYYFLLICFYFMGFSFLRGWLPDTTDTLKNC